jgi:hypothetical protein
VRNWGARALVTPVLEMHPSEHMTHWLPGARARERLRSLSGPRRITSNGHSAEPAIRGLSWTQVLWDKQVHSARGATLARERGVLVYEECLSREALVASVAFGACPGARFCHCERLLYRGHCRRRVAAAWFTTPARQPLSGLSAVVDLRFRTCKRNASEPQFSRLWDSPTRPCEQWMTAHPLWWTNVDLYDSVPGKSVHVRDFADNVCGLC